MASGEKRSDTSIMCINISHFEASLTTLRPVEALGRTPIASSRNEARFASIQIDGNEDMFNLPSKMQS